MQDVTRSSNRSRLWLAAGAALIVLAHMRWGIGIAGWFAPIPLLRYLRITEGWRSRLAFASVVTLAWVLTTAKIVSAPLPLMFALFGAPIGFLQIIGYLAADWIRRRLGDAAGIVVLPSAMVVLEHVQHRIAALGQGTWGAAGYTQLDNLPVLQLASVFGLAGVSYLIYLVAAAVEAAASARLDCRPRVRVNRIRSAVLVGVVVVHAWGSMRLALPTGETVRVAAIGTVGTFDGSSEVSSAERATIIDQLALDTEAAARGGAKLVVWTEAAALVSPAEEPALIARVRSLAVTSHVHVVAAYIVLLADSPLRFENKYAWARPDGELDHTYWKHHPAPGEPAIVGTEPLTAVEDDFATMGGALCYDYDFPALAQVHGALGVDLVALPSSDWRGIDPVHTQMAGLRAIEQGTSIIRSTRFGLSAGIDPLGRIRASSSSFDTAERVMIADLPRHGFATIYRAIGDVLVWAAGAVLLGALAKIARRRRHIRMRAVDRLGSLRTAVPLGSERPRYAGRLGGSRRVALG
jgi:apolipoprotein N-acyltransferase